MSKRQRAISALRLIAIGAVLLAILIGMPTILHRLLADRLSANVIRPAVLAATCAAVVIGYWVAIRRIERRPVFELDPDTALSFGATGLGFGVGLFCVTIAVLAAVGIARPLGYAGFGALPIMLLSSLTAAVTEEIVFRGALFQAVEKLGGRTAALSVSAALFGLAHALNPGATPVSTLAIAVEAGVLLGLAFAYAGNLWFPIGVHLGWNFCEGGIFGASVSGGRSSGIFPMVLQGPELLTGGAFGPEASVVAMSVSLTASLALGWRVWRNKRLATESPQARRRHRPTLPM